jgi:hypothetical protein
LKPSASEVEDAETVYNSLFRAEFSHYLQHGDAWSEDHHTSLKNLLLQLHSSQRVLRLFKEKIGEKGPYDVVIFTRSDLWFSNSLNMSEIALASKNPRVIYTPDFDHHSGLNDRFSFGGVDAMANITNRLNMAYSYAKNAQLHSESFLGAVVKSAGVEHHASGIRFARVRSNGLMEVDDIMKGVSPPKQYLHKNELGFWELAHKKNFL